LGSLQGNKVISTKQFSIWKGADECTEIIQVRDHVTILAFRN